MATKPSVIIVTTDETPAGKKHLETFKTFAVANRGKANFVYLLPTNEKFSD